MTKHFVNFTINKNLMCVYIYIYTNAQITSNNSGCVPLVDSWVEPTLSHVILQLMIVSIVGAKHQVGVAPQY